MPNGALRLVKRRADSAAADPAGGLLDAMTELEDCVEGVLDDGDGAVATTLLTASGGVESKQASMASPGTSRQPSPTSPPKVQRARVEPPAIALNKAVAEEDADADAARFVAAIMAYAHVSAETVSGNGHRGGDSLREMRAGVETHLLDVVNGAASDENAETCFVPGTVPTSIAENDHESQVALSYKSFPKPSPTEDARGVTTARLDGEATESSLSITKRETDQVVSATHKSLKQKRSTNPGAVAACAFVAPQSGSRVSSVRPESRGLREQFGAFHRPCMPRVITHTSAEHRTGVTVQTARVCGGDGRSGTYRRE